MRLHLFLAMAAILVAVAGVTAVASEQLGSDGGGTGEAQVIGGGDTTGSTTTPASSVGGSSTLPAGRVEVTGSVTSVRLDGAVLDPAEVPTPLTLTAEPGFGNGAEIAQVGVEGVRSTIVWDGGRPLVLSSGGALVLGPVTVELVSEGLRLALGDAEHRFRSGTYRLDTPVALGASGVGQAVDNVIFGADAQSTLRASGDTALLLDPVAARRFRVDGALRVEGTLRVTEGGATRSVSSIDALGVAADVTLTPNGPGRWTIELSLEGPFTAR